MDLVSQLDAIAHKYQRKMERTRCRHDMARMNARISQIRELRLSALDYGGK